MQQTESEARPFRVGDARLIEGVTSQLISDAYDLATWKTTQESYPRLQRAVHEAQSRLSTSPELLRDLFWSFYKPAPHFRENPLSPVGSIHRQILEQVMQTNEWEQMRACGSVNDPVISAMGTIALSRRLIESLDQETISYLNQFQQVGAEIRRLLDQAEGMQICADTALESTQAEQLAALARRMEAEAASQVALLGQLPQPTEAHMKQVAQQVRQASRGAIRQGMAAALDLNNAIGAFSAGSFGGRQGAGVSTSEKIELGKKMSQSDKLQAIAALCGKLKAFAHAVQQAKLEETPEQIDGITVGRQLSRVIPSELALLADELTFWLFAKKWVEGQLLHYDMQSYRMQGQGPIILALDSSGSMEDSLDGMTKEVWSKAVALAVAAIAYQQERDMAILHFSHTITSYQLFKRGQATVPELVGCCEHFDGGGTRFEPWMHKALDLVDTADFDRADVICISDGLTAIRQEMVEQWNTRRLSRGMRTFGILLGEEGAQEQGEEDEGVSVFRRITDVYIPLRQLSDETQIESIFAI